MRWEYFPQRSQTGLMAASGWIVLGWMWFWIPPDFIRDVGIRNSFLPFFIVFGLTCFWSILTVTGRWKRTLLWSMIITGAIWLRLNQLDSFLNLVLLFCFGGIWEYYWSLINRSVE